MLVPDFNCQVMAADGAEQSYVSKIETKMGNLSVEVHFVENNAWLAKKVLKVLAERSPAVLKYFKYEPSTTIHFVINEDSYTANGAALVFPRNVIFLNDFPPLNQGHLMINNNWIESLVIHELVHVIHMDQTRGFLSVVRSIFGSIGKMGGVVPRWFVEGVAVWAESEFLEGGRLKNEDLHHEFLSRLQDPNFCQTIDCLDEPGSYPYSQYPYWVGSYFLEFLEKSNPGTIQCLIFENSKTIPFNLNRAFRRCTRKTLWDNFKVYRKKTLGNLLIKKSGFSKIPSKFNLREHFEKDLGPIRWQRGFNLIGDEFVFVKDDQRIPLMGHYSLSKKKLNTSRTKLPIQDILLQQNELVYSTSLKGKTKVWYGLKEQNESYDYILKISPLKYLGFKYQKEHWNIYLENGKEKRKLIKEFAKRIQIEAPTFIKSEGSLFLSLKIYDDLKFFPYSIRKIRLSELEKNSKQLTTAYRSKKPFKLLSYCQSNITIKDSGGRYFFLTNNGNQEIFPFDDQNIVKIIWNKQKSLFIFKENPGVLYSSNKGCSEWEKSWTSKKAKTFKLPKNKIESPNKEDFSGLKYEEENYPQLKHFLPNYWLFSYQGGNNQVSVWKLYTQVNDPKNNHILGLSYDIYSGISESAPQINYNYKNGKFLLSLNYSKFYSTSSFGLEPDSQKSLGASAKYSFSLENWFLSPGISLSTVENKDFLSGGTARKGKSYGIFQSFGFMPIYSDDFFNKFSLYTTYDYRDFSNRKSYGSFQSKAKFLFKFHRRLSALVQGSYGKLYKKGFFDGVLYGGGQSLIGGSGAFHEFYGIPYSEIFGNEIQTNRLEFDWNSLKVYGSGGLFPLYFKNINTVLGFERVKADRIFLENRFFRNEEFYANYFGLRLDMTFAYALPIQLDILHSQLMGSKVGKNNQWLFLIKGRFSP